MKHPVFRRLLCALLAWVLVLGTLPVTALAEEPTLLEEASDSDITVETVAETTEETASEIIEEITVEAAADTVSAMEEESLLLEAEQADTSPEDEGEVFSVEIPFQVNPLYEGIVDPADYEDWEPEVIASSTYASTDEYLTEEEAAQLIRANMCARVESVTVAFASSKAYTDADWSALMAQAMIHTGVPTEGDYLRWQYAGYSANGDVIPSGGTYLYTMTFEIPYYTTAEQEMWMDEEIDSLITVLGLNSKGDYEKVKGIYDYICKNVTYDYANLNDETYKLKFTAYATLHDKTAVCQGYALLLYRLALELGVDCRFISGYGGGPHGWNIIQLGDKYYNADSTWDAGNSNYDYFLKGSEFDSTHVRDDEYNTDDFNATYPMDTEDYDPDKVVPQASCGENLLWKVEDGTLTIYADAAGTPGAMTDYSVTAPAPWAGMADQITDIDMQAGTTIGANAFKGLSNAAYIFLPDTLVDVAPGAFVGCTALTDFVIENGVTDGSYFADGPVLLQFTDSMGIGVATVSPSVEGHFDMPNYGVLFPGALLGCENITSICFYDYCRYLLNGSLEGCAEELTLFFEGTEPPYIGSKAFAGHVVTVAYCPVTQSWKEVARDGSYGGTAIWPEELLRDDETETWNVCGENLLWALENGTLTIYAAGTGIPGLMTDYSEAAPAPWAGLADQITAIDMQAGTTIGANAFVGLSEVRTVELPDSLTYVTPGAFVGCTKLSNFYFSGDSAFFADGPVLLKTTASDGIHVVTVAPSVTGSFAVPSHGVILSGALLGCENINAIYFRDNFRYLPEGALNGCAAELSLTFEGTVPPRIEDNAFAGHIVTVDCPVNWSWSRTAKCGAYGGEVTWPDGLLDMDVEMILKCGDAVLGDTLDADMADGTALTLSAQILPADAPQTALWTSNNTKVAAVDPETGEVTLNYPGTATITAAAADGLNASVTLNVFYLDPAEKLTAAVELPAIGLQPGQDTAMVVSGTTVIDADRLNFTSSNEAIAQVDASGKITAGEKTGTVTITASVKDDPLKRTVSVKVTVIALQAEAMKLTVDGEEQTALALAKSAESRTYPLTARMQNYREEWVETANVRWSSSNTSVAEITVSKDGTATLTIPGGVTGECVITAVSNDLNKVSAQLAVSVRDYAPRLVSNKLTLNCCTDVGAALDLRESYGNSIQELTLRESGTYAVSTRFTVSADGTVQAVEKLANGTYSQWLDARCSDGVTYRYSLQIRVANTLPSVTVKQTEKFNLFYLDSTAKLTITASGQTIERLELADTEDFVVDIDEESGAVSIAYSDTFLENPVTKPDTKATLKIWLDGYNEPVSKSITISTVTTAPKLRLSSTASTINTEYGDRSVCLWVADSNGDLMELHEGNTEVSASFANPSYGDGALTLTLNGTTGGTASIYVKQANWRDSVKLTHKISVTTKNPTIKLASTTLKLDRYFTQNTAQITVSLTQSNLTIQNLTVASTAKEGSSTRDQADKISLEYDGDAGCLIAKFKNIDDIPKAGTYSYTYSGTLPDGTPVKGGTLRVSVGGSLPKVKLSASTVKLNQQLKGNEVVEITPSVSGYSVVGFNDDYPWMTFENGKLCIRLTDDLTLGTHKFTLHAKVQHPSVEQWVTVEVPLTVQVYSGTPKVTLSAKGKLDTLNPNSAITYTPKLTNCIGTVTDVKLDEQYSTLFNTEVVNGTIRLTLKDQVQYATNITYKVRFQLTVCGQTLLSPVLRVKVTQSTVKVTAAPATLTLFQSQSEPLTGKLTLSAGEIETVAVSTKSSADLLAALKEFKAQLGGNTAALELSVQDASLLKAGKSYTLYLDVTPKNNAVNLKPTQVRLTVKVLK